MQNRPPSLLSQVQPVALLRSVAYIVFDIEIRTSYTMIQPSHVLQNFYNAGLHQSEEVYSLIRRITKLDTEQIKNWFEDARKADEKLQNPIPTASSQRPFMHNIS